MNRSNSANSSTSQGSRASSRPRLRRHYPYPTGKRAEDDDDGDDPPNRTSQRLKTQCEATPITNQEANSSSSFLGNISLMGFARSFSWISGNTDLETPAEESDDNGDCNTDHLSPLKVSLPISTPGTPGIVIHPPSDAGPNESCLITPASVKPGQDAFYTGYGDPEITPVPRTKAKGLPNTLKALLHTPSLSPRQVIQEKHRNRRHSFSNRITAATPKVSEEFVKTQDRSRHISEGDVASLKVTNTDASPLQYKRYMIQDQGLHTCDGHPFELSDRSFFEDSEISLHSVQSAIKVALREVSPEITPGQSTSSCTELFWRPSVIRSLCNDLNSGLQSNTSSPSNPEDKNFLKALLAVINTRLGALGTKNLLFNGLRIVYSFDRTSRMPLKNTHKDDDMPLVILHIGKPRDLSITPLRFNPAIEATEVCDVSLGNFSLVTLFPESTKHLHCYFPPETKRGDSGDEQVLIIPYVEDVPEVRDDSATSLTTKSQLNISDIEPPTPDITPPVSTTETSASLLITTNETSLPIPTGSTTAPDAYCTKHDITSVDHPLESRSNKQHSENSANVTDGEEIDYEIPSVNNIDPIVFRYITLDLFKNAVNSHKKNALMSLMSTLGLKGSNNVTANKKKICDILEMCETTGSTETIKLVTHLTNKLEDSVIKLELLANNLPLGNSARERKNDLVAFCKSQHGCHVITRLVFDNLDEELPGNLLYDNTIQSQNTKFSVNEPNSDNLGDHTTSDGHPASSSDTKPHFTPSQMQSCNESSKSKKLKSKKKKKRDKDSTGSSVTTPGDARIPLQIYEQITHDNNDENRQNLGAKPEDHLTQSSCNNCSELKRSMSVLQDSLLELKDEMLQQKAISDIIISSPTTSEKSMSIAIKNKLGPIDTKLSELRDDLEKLRAAVDEQNIILEKLTNSKAQLEDKLNTMQSFTLTVLTKTNSANKMRIETLEIGHENLTKATKAIAKSTLDQTHESILELKHELRPTVEVNETTSASNRTRIEALELNVEETLQVLSSSNQSLADNKVAAHSPPTTNSKPILRHDKPSTLRDNSTDAAVGKPKTSARSWSQVAEKGDNKRFTVANKQNTKNHREEDRLGNDGHRNHVLRREDNSNISSSINDIKSYRRHTVLLIHDENFDEFDPRRFNSQFNVHCFKATSYSDLLKNSKQLNKTLKRLKPECIYIHTGINDFLYKKTGLVGHVKELYLHLLKTTAAQICFSALIPSSNDYYINDRIRIVNEETRNHITWLHNHKPEVKDRIFTFTNEKIGDQSTYSPSTGFKLSQRGQNMLWLRLREGLRKTLRLPRLSYHEGNKARRSTNRYCDE